MSTTVASLLKRLKAEEDRRKAGDATALGRIGELEARVSALEKAPVEPPPIEPPPVESPPSGWTKVFSSDFAHGLRGFVFNPPIEPGSDNETLPVCHPDGTCTIGLGPGQGRTELSINNGTDAQKWTEGERLLTKETFYVPVGFPYGGPGKHCTIQQFRQSSPAGSPLLSLELGDYGKGNGLYLHDKTQGDEYRFVLSATAIEGLRLVTELEIVTSRIGNGGYSLACGLATVLNDVGGALTRNNVNTIPPGASYAYIKTGLYRSPISSASEIVISDLSVSVPA